MTEMAVGRSREGVGGVMDDRGTARVRITPWVCKCGECTPRRAVCWGCVICRSGPFRYDPRGGGGRLPFLTRTAMAPGSNYGVGFSVCSEQCKLTLDRLGVPAVEVPPATPPPDSTADPALVDQFVDQLPSPERAYVMRLAGGRTQSPASVITSIVDEIVVLDAWEKFRAVLRGPSARPAGPETPNLLAALDMPPEPRARVEQLAAERGEPVGQILVMMVEWYREQFYVSRD